MLAPLKLAAAQAWLAWRAYPATRRSLVAARPGPPVLVTGVYRSGTTWVGSMLAAAGLWHLHEPFNPNRGLWPNELEYADPGRAHPALDDFVLRLLRGRHRSALRLPRSGRWFMPLRLLPLRPRRILIKDPSAALLTEYLVRRHGMHALIIFRHPAAIVSSFLRLDWPTGMLVERLLADEALVTGPLAGESRSMQEAAGRRDAFSGAVLCACLARVLWGFAERNRGTVCGLSFEELCLDPIEGFRALFERQNLGYDESVRAVHQRLTGGGTRHESEHGVVRSSADVARRWRARMAPGDLGVIREVWDRLGPPLYGDPAEWRADRSGSGHARDAR